jgi:hypothetical protein
LNLRLSNAIPTFKIMGNDPVKKWAKKLNRAFSKEEA